MGLKTRPRTGAYYYINHYYNLFFFYLFVDNRYYWIGQIIDCSPIDTICSMFYVVIHLNNRVIFRLLQTPVQYVRTDDDGNDTINCVYLRQKKSLCV